MPITSHPIFSSGQILKQFSRIEALLSVVVFCVMIASGPSMAQINDARPNSNFSPPHSQAPAITNGMKNPGRPSSRFKTDSNNAYIAPAIPHKTVPLASHERWCAENHKSYNRKDNSYQPFGGSRQNCISPYSK